MTAARVGYALGAWVVVAILGALAFRELRGIWKKP
jgi:hypothetical protein